MSNTPDLISDKYYDAYVKAVSNPIQQLKETFKLEGEMLFNLMFAKHMKTFLDVGCGNGRTLNTLNDMYIDGRIHFNYYGIDHNPRMQPLFEENISKLNKQNPNLKINFQAKDVFEDMNSFSPKQYSIVYSGFNLIGSIYKELRNDLISQKIKLTEYGGLTITTSWKQTAECTEFLKEYYPSIGCKINHIDNEKIMFDNFNIYRVSLEEIAELYFKNGSNEVSAYNIGPLWSAVIGCKQK